THPCGRQKVQIALASLGASLNHRPRRSLRKALGSIDDVSASIFIALMPRPTSRLYLVDVSSYIFRAFHAIPPLNNKNGLPTNAVLGVVNMLLKLVNEERPERMGIVFDSAGPTFRDEIDGDYKANRSPTPDALVPQLPYVRKVIEAFRLHCVEVPGVEADDVIATLARSFASESNEVVVVTGDKDLMQLVGPHVTL